jgi:mannosyltransferase
VLILISFKVPLLTGRYLLYTVAAWVLLAGAALARAGNRELWTILTIVFILGLPTQVDIRGPVMNRQPDYRSIAKIMSRNVRSGDAIVMPRDRGWRLRVALRVYLPPSSWPDDVLQVAGPEATETFDSLQCETASCLGDPPRIWLSCPTTCKEPLLSYRNGVSAELQRVITLKGYRLQHMWHVHNGAIAVYSH